MAIQDISNIFVLGIAVLVFLDLTSLFKNKHTDLRSVIVTVGIFGTFLGIFLGLQEFDTTDISGSVPPLLEGMKLAFLTSVVALGSSVGLTLIATFTGKEIPSEEFGVLKEVEAKLQEVVDEIKNGFKVTNYNLEHAFEKLAEGASGEIIDALNKVIADFNTNLKEQFGENFKQLNESVKKLLDWQESYSDQVTKNEEFLSTTTKALETSVASMNDSVATITAIGSAMEGIEKAADTILAQSVTTGEALEAQRRIVGELDELLAQFTGKLSEISSKTEELATGMTDSLSKQSDVVAQLTTDLQKKLPESLGQLERTLTGLTKQFGEDYQRYLEAVQKLVKDAAA